MAFLGHPVLRGYRSRWRGKMDFYRCPACGHRQESLSLGSDGLAACYRCTKAYRQKEWGSAKVIRTFVECAGCHLAYSLTESNFALSGIGWLCPPCGNYLAIKYTAGGVNTPRLFDSDWNPTIFTRGVLVAGQCAFVRCRSKKDFLTLIGMQVVAKEEDSRLLFCHSRENNAAVLFDRKRREYLGYIVWCYRRENAELNQFYVDAGHRRCGLASAMVEYWVRRYAVPVADKFGIESPNQHALQLLEKLGHMIREGDSVRFVRCFRVVGL